MAIATINPATGELVRSFAALTDAELEAKLARAQEAFAAHRRTAFAWRAERMVAAAEILERDKERFARLMTLEMGKPLVQARAEVQKCATGCRYYAAHAEKFLADEPLPEASGRCHVRYKPLGPVLAIMPWNFPFWQVIRFAAPALMAGNVGLLKHAPSVPQCAMALEEVFLRAGFPEGCFQALLIENETVARVIEDERVAAVTLTGSVGAGRAVAAVAGRAIKRTVLELGGSDPFVVLASADLDDAVRVAVTARVQNNGQSCIAAKRFIVVDAVADEFETRFIESMDSLVVGDPFDPATNIGPIVSEAQRDELVGQVEEALRQGATVHNGAPIPEGDGWWFAPTVLSGVTTDMPIAQVEMFGPVAMVIRVPDVDAAIATANDTTFGLGSSVWASDQVEIARCIEGIEAGAVFVNAMVASLPELPFGGIKRSGYGRELSELGLKEFTNAKTVYVA